MVVLPKGILELTGQIQGLNAVPLSCGQALESRCFLGQELVKEPIYTHRQSSIERLYTVY